MSWKNSTREYITFVSPEANVFVASWKNNERSVEKKLGIFDPPNFKGSIVQDLNCKSTSYPLTVYFDGMSHYDDANKFWKALTEEIGQWEITHPTKGGLILQLVSAKESINPVDDGNFTTFETTWLEPANVERLISADESIMGVLTQIANTIEDGITQIQQLRSDLYSGIQAAANMMNQISGLSTTIMAELAATDVIVNDAWVTAKNSLDSLIAMFQADASDTDNQADMGQVFSDVISIPLQADDDYSTRYSVYSDMADAVIDISPATATPDDYNKVVFQELGILAILCSICQIIVTSNFKTRSEIISAMDNITTVFNDTINALEAVQEQFEGLDIDLQYFSQSKSWSSIQYLFALTMQYLLTQFFNSKSEKIFTLKNARSPIEITITEYGSMGDNDSNYELFLASNNLYGNDILLLPAGRSVTVYV